MIIMPLSTNNISNFVNDDNVLFTDNITIFVNDDNDIKCQLPH